MYALAYPVAPHVNGGLGHHARQVLDACVDVLPSVRAFGPAIHAEPPDIEVISPPLRAEWRRRYTWRRYLHGAAQVESDRAVGRWLAAAMDQEYEGLYVFTQIALEVLERSRERRIPHVLDNPNGHIRHFRASVQQEAERWLSGPYPGHPTGAMVQRVEAEYAAASCIRVASGWSARTMAANGVDLQHVTIVPHGVELTRFVPPRVRIRQPDRLRLLFVGSLTLAKGFQYLLQAVRRIGSGVSLRVVGNTGDPWCRRLFRQLTVDLDVAVTPGDPVPAYHEADVLVLPTLHDGFGLVVAEAMACGLPVITTEACGAAEWLVTGDTGWVVPPADAEALAAAIAQAVEHRRDLVEMGAAARHLAEAVSRQAEHRLRAMIGSTLLRQPSNEALAAGPR